MHAVDLLKWLDLDSQTLTALIIGGGVVLIVTVLALRSLLSSRLVVIVGGVLAVGAIAPGVLGALGNLIGGLLGGLIPLAVIVIGSVFALLIVLKRNPDLREWLHPLLPRRPIESSLPPTSVETLAWQPHQYTVIDMPRYSAPRRESTPALPAPTKRTKRRSQHLHDWGF
jgi:hypothetical protein